MADWIEIVIPATDASVDDVAALLCDEVEVAREGSEIRGSDIILWTTLAHADQAFAEVRAATLRMAATGVAVDASSVRTRPAAPEAEWRDAWKRYFHVTRITRQLTIVPSWETHAPANDEIVLHLDPGMAFGTGAHASTRLVLEEMQELHDQGTAISRVLDAGTGSGILAIAASLLWPQSTTLAVDNDPVAVSVARENCERNALSGRVVCAGTLIGDIDERFDLVLANIEAPVLLELSKDVAARVAPGGRVVLSGILTARIDEVATAYRDRHGFDIETVRRSSHDPEWSSTTLRRPV